MNVSEVTTASAALVREMRSVTHNAPHQGIAIPFPPPSRPACASPQAMHDTPHPMTPRTQSTHNVPQQLTTRAVGTHVPRSKDSGLWEHGMTTEFERGPPGLSRMGAARKSRGVSAAPISASTGPA